MTFKKIAKIGNRCVACGACVLVCPLKALHIKNGVHAAVANTCVGCGKCAATCPAGIITIELKEQNND